MQHYRLPEAERRGYKNVFDALIRITKEEGVFTLWRVSIWKTILLIFFIFPYKEERKKILNGL